MLKIPMRTKMCAFYNLKMDDMLLFLRGLKFKINKWNVF